MKILCWYLGVSIVCSTILVVVRWNATRGKEIPASD